MELFTVFFFLPIFPSHTWQDETHPAVGWSRAKQGLKYIRFQLTAVHQGRAQGATRPSQLSGPSLVAAPGRG